MKVGIISDVHGDYDGLEQALSVLDRHKVDAIVCAGDLIDRGGRDEDVIRRVRDLNIPTVRGNHDHRGKQTNARMRSNDEYRERLLNSGMGITELDDDTLAYLSELPKTLRFRWAGVDVLIAHGSPTHMDTYIFANALPQALRRVVEDAAPADIVVLGHTHVPMQLQVGDTRIINPGSVYHNYESFSVRKTCGLLMLPSKRFTLLNVETGAPLLLDVIHRKVD